MKPINVALIGLGTVGSGVYQTIHIQQQRLEDLLGAPVHISTIVIEHDEKHEKIGAKTDITTDITDILRDPDIDVVFEAIVGREPAFTYLKQCIQAKKHVITSNKEMFAAHGSELKVLANEHDVKIGYDATTAGGVPIIQTIQQVLKANQIQQVQAILTGTTNYVLTAIRKKQVSLIEALREAEEWGYAEADPTTDIEGHDALFKLMILSELIFEKQPNLEHIKRKGISEITDKTIQEAAAEGKRIKHIASLAYSTTTGELTASIEPVAVTEEHPLYAVEGVNNAIHLKTNILGDLTLTGPGAGSFPTASAMVEDLCSIFQNEKIVLPV